MGPQVAGGSDAFKIAVVGTGAMGSVYTALLRRAGHEVWAIDRWEEHLRAIERRGLRLSGPLGDEVIEGIRVGRSPEEAGESDYWLIATKSFDVDVVARRIAPMLRPGDTVIPFQNGLGAGERVAQHIPSDQIVIGIAEGFGSSIPEPGHVHHNGMRLIRIGELHGGLTERLERIEQLWRDAGFTISAFADINRMIWEKFLCNVTLSAPTAVFDLTVGELMANSEAWAVAIGCMLEAHRLGTVREVEFGFDDPIAYVTEFAASIPGASPSMRLDHLAGRRSEIDVINGAVVELSRTHGLEAPFNQTLCAVLRAREARF
jgi:2-dehydropantoate 2-reductase